MGIYVGRIDFMGINGKYYNFTPLYEYSDGKLIELMDHDYDRIVPESKNKNIWFSFNYNSVSQTEFMESYFYEDIPVVFEFDTNRLDFNIDSRTGNLNDTGYKINTREEFDKGNIRRIAELGYYLVLEEEEVVGDPRKTNAVRVGTSGLTDKSEIFIKLKDEGIYVGPYEVTYWDTEEQYVVRTEPDKNNYLLSGYDKNACVFIRMELDGQLWVYLKPNNGAIKKKVDVITDKLLLDSFRSVISSDLLVDGKLDLSDIDAAKEFFEKSYLAVEDEKVRNKRLNRINAQLKIGANVEDAIQSISESLGSDLGSLLSKYDNAETAEALFKAIFEMNPDLLNKFQDYRYTMGQLEDLEGQKERLQGELDTIQSEIKTAKENAAAERELLRDEALMLEIENAKAERDRLKEEVSVLQEKYDQFSNYEELQNGVAELKKRNDYEEYRKEELTKVTNDLSKKLTDVTTSIEEKLSDMPIDGLVANLIVESSASWKSNLEREHYNSIIYKCSEIEVSEKTPEEMVEYMYQRVKEVRPLYDKNTVTNICTCIFQNFLTVFSGDPGCGKTSMCNIVGQALGLKKLGDIVSRDATRYIPVSVERGWTSKRDFIGYYNPLTKTFDKNNKRVFEALQIADLEEEKGIAAFPMIILLDEANLSPMEYYWADFMNICDDLTVSNEINIGESTVLNIPETLHFVATINNDHTTETLSPRLIDRAAVITLPKVSLRDVLVSTDTGEISDEGIDLISWNTIKKTYIDPSNGVLSFPAAAKKTYEEVIKNLLRKREIYVSPRTEKALMKYCAVTERLFDRTDDRYKRDPAIIALDYAISQKILPKIDGYGDDYAEWLKEFMEKCDENYLYESSRIIKDIISKGVANMSYFKFFG